MKSFVTACWLAVVFLANLLINAPITRLYPVMAPGVYFAMLAAAMVVVVVVFQPIAARFNRGMADGQGSGGGGQGPRGTGPRRCDRLPSVPRHGGSTTRPAVDPAGQRRDVREPGLGRIAAPLMLRTPWWQ